LIAARFLVFSQIVDGNSPLNWLLEMFSTRNDRSGIDGRDSCRIPLRRLKLTSRIVIVPEDISSDGRLPESELYDRLRRNKPLKLPRDGEMLPSNLLEAKVTSITTPL
jgi:hypothetical protein